MSESAKTIIKYFCDRFLDIDYYPTSLKDILDLGINRLKNIDEEDVVKFNRININNLRDLSMVQISEYERLSKKALINKSNFKNALIAAILIANAWSKRTQYMKKPKMKVVVAGLNFAGKTSLINRLVNDINYNDMINLEPTIGANVEEYQSDKLDLILWDLGGQKDNIEEYLESPERFFIQVDVLIFVFDSQDDVRYDAAAEYLKDLINILAFLNESPYIVILLNKADSDIVNDPDFQIKVEYLTDKISTVFMDSEKSWNFDITPTSIYNFYSSEPEIARSIKNIFSKEKSELDSSTILPNIEDKLQRILDINLKLMDKVAAELSEVKRVLFRLVPSDISQSLCAVPFEKVPIEYISDTQKLEDKDKKKRKKSKDADPFKKGKKLKGAAGPPKRLKSITTLEALEKKDTESDKITTKKIKSVKASLSATSQKTTPPIAPQSVAKQSFVTLDSLKPPPPPPKIMMNAGSKSGAGRSEIISELKDMFVKRGLVSR